MDSNDIGTNVQKNLLAQVHFSSSIQLVEVIVFKSSINKMLSPVLFISGPSALLTFGNLLNEREDGLFDRKTFQVRGVIKIKHFVFANMTLVA